MLGIHNLPAELLSCIFEAYVKPPLNSSPSRLRMVCKRWRDIAEATPYIWSGMILGCGRQWTQRALKWSGVCPIDLDGTAGSSRDDWHDCMLLSLDHIHRIRDLLLEFPAGHYRLRIAHIMSMLEDRAAPLLEVFHLDGHDSRRAQPELGGSFMSTPPPRLRDVKLSRCAITLRCPILHAPQLAHLTIDDCTLWTNVNEVLKTLRALPQLEHFHWRERDFPIDNFTDSTLLSSRGTGIDSTRMLNLRSLSIRHDAEVIVHILACVEIPPNCQLLLNTDLFHNPVSAALVDAMDRVLSPYLSARFPTGSGKGFAGFAVTEFHDRPDHGITAKWSMESDIDKMIDGDEDFSLTFHGGNSREDEKLDLIWRMIDRWPATGVAVKRIAAWHDALFETDPAVFAQGLPSWATTLNKFAVVEELLVSGTATAFLPELLSSPYVRLFPMLRHIAIQWAGYESSEASLLVEALLQRHNGHGKPTAAPSRIVLEDCEVDGVTQPRREVLVTLGTPS
ncbi:hypothetical protein PENSPDRAFT_754926 [Peniophora sp. CONT]|nr:hypothetical protein PENSPDRAFT_754926 [Peniophora sp. CONT]